MITNDVQYRTKSPTGQRFSTLTDAGAVVAVLGWQDPTYGGLVTAPMPVMHAGYASQAMDRVASTITVIQVRNSVITVCPETCRSLRV